MKTNDYFSFNRFYFDILIDSAPLDDYKFVELYSSPYNYDKIKNIGPEASWEKVIDKTLDQANVEESYLTEIV
jgi:hypothetical protein